MSKEQLANLESEKANMSSSELSDEMMVMAYEIRFWKNKAWRAEQQKEREILARKEAEAKLDRFKGLTQQDLDEMLTSRKKEQLEKVMAEANNIIGVLPWVKYQKEAEGITDLDARIRFWMDLVTYYEKEWKDED